MTIQFKEGDKVRILTKVSRAHNAVDTGVPHIVEDVNDYAYGVRNSETWRYHSILVKDVEPWRDEPPTLSASDERASVSEQLAAKRQEIASKQAQILELCEQREKTLDRIIALQSEVEPIENEIAALEAQLEREQADARLAEIEAERQRLDEEEARLRALVTPKVEVGAIVDLIYVDGRIRAAVNDVSATGVMATGADGFAYYARPFDKVDVIFPANHLVAQSLASRTLGANAENGEYRTGDVIVFTEEYPVSAYHGKRVVLARNMNEYNDFWYLDKASITSDMPIGYGWNRTSTPEGARLVTPRELRVDIGDASGGEWTKWFTADGEEVAA